MIPLTRSRGRRARLAAVVVVVLLQPAAESHALVQPLVSSGVSGLVDGLPAFGDPTFMWTTTPRCDDFLQPGNETRPALITRASLTIGSPRIIFSYNPPRAVGVCNPYRLLSNVYAFAGELYYIDNLGDGGRPALWRRARDANPNDPSRFVAFVGNSVVSAQIIVFGSSVMAILENTNPFLQPNVLVHFHKDTGEFVGGTIDSGNSGALTSLRYDGRYLYWLNFGALRRHDTTTGEVVTVLNGPVQSLYVYPYDEDCNGATCRPISRIVYSQGNRIIEADTLNNQSFPVYTSADPNARIGGIERGPIHYYFIERRPAGEFNVDYRFFRESIALGTPDLILGPITGNDAGYDGFRSDDTWLYFHERATGRLLRLSTSEAAIPIRDLRATGLEVTQALQNSANALRLIADKQTFVRFYVRSGNGTDVAGVTASLAGVNDNGFLGRLEPVNNLGKTITVRANTTRTSLHLDFQFELPLHWTTGGRLELTGMVNPAGRQVEEVVTDNSFTRQVDFSASERLVVLYYNWSYDLGGTRYTPSAAELTASRQRMRRLYPLGIPGSDPDSAGLHLRAIDIVDNALTAQVTRTDADCVKRHKNADDRNMCASEYVHGRMAAFRQSSNIAAGFVSYGNIAQAPAPAGLSYFTRGYANGQIASGPSSDANYASHEVGHVLQRAHPSEGATVCGHSASDPNYPYFASYIDNPSAGSETRFQGLDFSDGVPKSLTLLSASSWHDTMSYCSPNWISDYTFEGMYQYLISDARPRLGAPTPRQAVTGDWLLLSGIVDPADQDGGFTIVQRTGFVMDATPPAAGAFTLELRNSTGGVLASHSFAANPIDDRPGTSAFDLVVRFVPATAELRVIENATRRVLADAAISATPPSVSDVQLPGAPDPVDGIVTVTWNAGDDDGDDLRFDVFATGDGGATYRPIHFGIEDTRVMLDASMLGGGPTRLRVVASDGAHTAFAESRTFTARARAPKVVITSPADGARIDWGQLVTLAADIDDLHDTVIPDEQISWSSSALDGAFASGRLVQTDQLPVGEQALEVRVANSLGAVATASITVVVGDLLTIPGPTLAITPQQIAWHVAASDTTPQVRPIAVENASEGTLAFDVSSDAPWLLIDSQAAITDAVAPRTFTVVATPMLVPAGVTSRGSLTFVNQDDPDDIVVVPVELARGNVFDHTGEEPLAECAGDCDASGDVVVSELVRGVNISLGTTSLSACSAFDRDADGQVKVNELVLAVRAALSGCQ